MLCLPIGFLRCVHLVLHFNFELQSMGHGTNKYRRFVAANATEFSDGTPQPSHLISHQYHFHLSD
jgi:hypothetical protein